MIPETSKSQSNQFQGLRRVKSTQKNANLYISDQPEKQYFGTHLKEKLQVLQKSRQLVSMGTPKTAVCEIIGKNNRKKLQQQTKSKGKLNFQTNLKEKRQKNMQQFMEKIQEMKKIIAADSKAEKQFQISQKISNPINHRKMKKAISIDSVIKQDERHQQKQIKNQPSMFSQQLIKAQKIQVLHPVRSGHKYNETTSTNSSRKSYSQAQINDFIIWKKIGNGKFGEVYLVQHKRSSLLFALKKIKKKDLDDKLKSQLIQEIKIQMFMNHPNIVKLYTFFTDEEHIFLLMELVLSGHLYALVCDKPKQCLDEKTVKVISKQLCQGLQHLHNNGIIHRDLKLENVLYQMGMIKICDFGWAIETKIMRETFCGTPLYFSPEILHQKGYNSKVDIWSLGVLTYQLLNGTVPFEIQQQRDFSKIIIDDVMFPKTYEHSNSSKQFIKACLNKNPESRPCAQELLNYEFINFESLQSPQLF